MHYQCDKNFLKIDEFGVFDTKNRNRVVFQLAAFLSHVDGRFRILFCSYLTMTVANFKLVFKCSVGFIHIRLLDQFKFCLIFSSEIIID